MIFFLNTNFSLSFYKRTRSSSFIRTRSSWISRIFVRGGALTGGTHDVEHLILLNTNLTNNTNLFGTRIFLFLYAHGSHGSHGFCLRHFEHEIFFEHLILLNTNLTNNTNLFGMRIFLFFIHTRISRISRIFLPTAVLDYGILGFLMRHKK